MLPFAIYGIVLYVQKKIEKIMVKLIGIDYLNARRDDMFNTFLQTA